MLADLLAGSEPPSRSKGKEKNLPPCPELFVAFVTQCQSPDSTAIFNSWYKQERQGSHCWTDSSLPQISGQMYFEALIAGTAGVSREDFRPEDFVLGKNAQGGEDHIPGKLQAGQKPWDTIATRQLKMVMKAGPELRSDMLRLLTRWALAINY